MKGHDHPQMRPWMLLVPVGVFVLVAHSVVLDYVLSHTALSTAVVSGVIVFIVIKHLGLVGPLTGPFRHRTRR